MNLTVEWVDKETRFRPAVAYRGEHIPIIRVDALRRWITRANQDAENGLSLEAAFGYRAAINDLLAQLPAE